MTDAKAWVEERRAIHAKAKEYPAVVPQSPTWMDALKALGEYELDAKVNFPRALDALNAVLELHKAVFDIHDPDARAYCHECGYRPCATVQAIKGAING